MMTILRNLFRYAFFVLLGCSFIALLLISLTPKPAPSQIAIFSSFSHPLFDDCVQSCKTFLAACETPPEVVVFNAEDNISKAKKIARNLHTQPRVAAVIALGPMATKVMSQIEKNKPIIYAGVSETDLVDLQHETNVHGVNANIDIGRCCFAIQTIIPNIDTLIYLRPVEPFPSLLQKEITEKLHASGIKVSECSVSSANMKNRVHQVIEKKPAAIFIPLSSLSQRHEVEEIIQADIPVITNDATLIAKGACVACSIDYELSGKQLAQMAYHILHNRSDNKSLRTIIAEPVPTTLTYNEDFLQRVGITHNEGKKA